MKVSITFAHPLTRMVLGSDAQQVFNQKWPFWGLTRFASKAFRALKSGSESVGFVPQNFPIVGPADQFLSQPIKPAIIYSLEGEPVLQNFKLPPKYLAGLMYRTGIREVTIQGTVNMRDVSETLRTVLCYAPDFVKKDLEIDGGVEYKDEKLPVEVEPGGVVNIYGELIRARQAIFQNDQILETASSFSKTILQLLLYYQRDLELMRPGEIITYPLGLSLFENNRNLSIREISLILANLKDSMIFHLAQELIEGYALFRTDSEFLLRVLAQKWRLGQVLGSPFVSLVEEIAVNQEVDPLLLQKICQEDWFRMTSYGGQSWPGQESDIVHLYDEIELRIAAAEQGPPI